MENLQAIATQTLRRADTVKNHAITQELKVHELEQELREARGQLFQLELEQAILTARGNLALELWKGDRSE